MRPRRDRDGRGSCGAKQFRTWRTEVQSHSSKARRQEAHRNSATLKSQTRVEALQSLGRARGLTGPQMDWRMVAAGGAPGDGSRMSGGRAAEGSAYRVTSQSWKLRRPRRWSRPLRKRESTRTRRSSWRRLLEGSSGGAGEEPKEKEWE